MFTFYAVLSSGQLRGFTAPLIEEAILVSRTEVRRNFFVAEDRNSRTTEEGISVMRQKEEKAETKLHQTQSNLVEIKIADSADNASYFSKI